MSDTPQALLPRTLHIHLDGEAVCFARYELRREPFFAFSRVELQPRVTLAATLRDACGTEAVLQQPAAQVEVVLPVAVTAVPLADFQEEDCESFYNYCFAPDDAPRRVFYDVLPQAGAVLVFALADETCHAVEKAFGPVHFTASLTHLLKRFAARRNMADGEKRLFVNLHGHKADVAAFDAGRLLVVNTYEAQSEADAAYFALCIARNLAMDCRKDAFYVTGDGGMREAVALELKEYAANVYNINPTGEFNRNIVSTTPGVPYDLMAVLMENS